MRARLVSWMMTFRTRASLRALVTIAAAPLALSRVAGAQVNLPPPPPPPIDTTSPPPSGTSGSSTSTHHPKPPPPKHAAEPAHTAAPPPPEHHEEHHEPAPQPRPEPVWSSRTMSIRLNPLPFFLSRVSADFEIMLAPHHALVVSPNFTLKKFAFHRSDLMTYGLGYANDDSSGFGAEVGYHYWTKRELDGIFFGPSLVLGGTFPPNGSGVKTFGYIGGAVDVGYQYLFSNGFTLLGGGGIMLIGGTTTGATVKAVPRLLFGVGWSF
ncbi:MAG: DUF3575 domain-containing protein [Polyangiaceae bacterium]